MPDPLLINGDRPLVLFPVRLETRFFGQECASVCSRTRFMSTRMSRAHGGRARMGQAFPHECCGTRPRKKCGKCVAAAVRSVMARSVGMGRASTDADQSADSAGHDESRPNFQSLAGASRHADQ